MNQKIEGMNETDALIINHLRSLSLDMINEAGYGYPGICLGAANIMYTLYSRHINISVMDSTWVNRDRFIMSAGHGAPLMYANLYLAGYDISLDDLKDYASLNSKTPAFPHLGSTNGVDFSTGLLGQGIASAVGMALGETNLNSKYVLGGSNLLNKPRCFYDFYTYVLAGDADLMEGVSYEACSLAGHLGLGKLIVLYDSNNITSDGSITSSFTEDVKARFEAMGWHYQLVSDDNNINAIDDAIFYAKEEKDKPSIIEVKTTIGKYSPYQGSNNAHNTLLKPSEVNGIKRSFGIDIEPFNIDPRVREVYKDMIYKRTSPVYNNWATIYNDYMKSNNHDQIKELAQLITGKFDIAYDMLNISGSFLTNETLVQSNKRVMETLSFYCHNLIGGTANTVNETQILLDNKGFYRKGNRLGQNIMYGNREHAMAAITNGLAALNLTPFSGAFLMYADYMKPAIKLSSIMNLPVTYIFTHDTYRMGPAGKTHQPVEQLDQLRLMPNLDVYRPSSVAEVSGCWINIIKRRRPAALVISESTVDPTIPTNSNYVALGAYPIIIEQTRPDAIIISSGVDLSLAYAVTKDLINSGLSVRLVSMVSKELFQEQDINYKLQTLPLGIKTFVIESSTASSLERYASGTNYIFNITNFGYSGKVEDVSEMLNMTKDKISMIIKRMAKN